MPQPENDSTNNLTSEARWEPLTALELASGIVTGGPPAPRLPREAARPGDLLRGAIVPALERGPCLVSFSGGIDSSLVLSAAAQAARSNSLPDPIPITWRFEEAPGAQESEWQERVVNELGLRDWLRLSAEPGQLDLVGPVAARMLARHGVLHPANAFLHLPLLEHARGGTLLTGVGGDQVLGLWRWRDAAAVMRREVPLRPRSALTVARSLAPVAIRARLERWDQTVDSPWLRPGPQREVRARYGREVASEPPDWRRRVAWQVSRRDLRLGLGSLALLAADAGVEIEHPLLDLRFVSAVAAAGGRLGAGSRAATVEAMLGDVLPAPLRQRRTKALFDQVFWQAPARELMADWEGGGVDEALVDTAALRSLWRTPELHPRTAHLLQAASLGRLKRPER